jgi:flagellar hook-associated protein 2
MATVSPTSSTGTTTSTGSTAPTGVTSGQSSSSVDRSGLSVDDVVDAKLAPYLNQIDSISTTITSNQTKVSAYQDMQQLLTNLENSLDALRNPIDSTTDVFNMRAASLTSSDASITAANVMSVTVDPGTDEGSHTVKVTQLAQVERLSSGTQTSRTTALGETGTFSIGESGKTSASINITATMSLNDVVSAINAQESTTGVTANIVAVTGSTYQLVLTGADTNQTINMSTGSGTVLSDLGLTQADGSTAATVLQEAKPAELTVDGVAIQRDTNDVDDAIDGVTMNLTALTNGATVTVNIGNDTTSVSDAIQTFATSYNAWRTFVSQNQATNSDGTASSSATLFGDSTLRQTSTAIDSALTSLIGSTSLGAIGITVNANNELDIDTTTLTTALQTNFSSVQQLFSYTADTSSSDLRLTGHGDSTYSGSFTVNVTTDSNGNLTGATATDSNGNTTALKVSGRLIEGATGSAYDGLIFAYSGDQNESITVNASQGIADQMYQVSAQAGDPNLGSVQSLISDLQNTDNTLTSNMNDLQSEANNYYTYLLNYYGTLESSISEANQTSTLLQQMMALDATNNG